MLKFADRFLSVFFPKRCKYCGELIVPEKDVCESCENSLPRILSPCCPFCGHSKEDCSCKQAKSEYTAVAAPFYYEGAAKTAIHRLKFEGKDFVARTLAQDMAKTVKEQYGEKEFDIITFVPFSKAEKHDREFNQSELLAKCLGEELCLPCREMLVKLYDVPRQHTLPGNKRRGNVFGIFAAAEEFSYLDGKTILLADDIKTTGSTLSECAKMLKIAGAKEVCAVTAAIAKKIG